MATKEIELAELDRIYSRAEEVDKDLFAEMRSNILLVAGEHYSKLNQRVSAQIRQSNKPAATQEQKLRLTKNHMHKVSRSYKTAILGGAPSTAVFPKNDTELQDKKDAELNQSVWKDQQDRHKLSERRSKWGDQFVNIGEVCVKIFWDHNAGDFKGYANKVDDNTGEEVLESTGQMEIVNDPSTGQPIGQREQMAPVPDEDNPVFTGALVYEDVFGFNLLREAGATGPEDRDRAWVIRKMVDIDELKRQYKDNDELISKLTSDNQETFVVFDSQKGSYEKRKDQCLLREFYWPPSARFPKGWYCYAVKTTILAQDELPLGIWPIAWKGFDEYPTSSRGRSILKVARPFQAEINRASSAMAVAQVTLGDDKILYQAGSKLAPGALLPGVRGIAYQGKEPTVLPGRNGAQYLEYIQAQKEELYEVVMIDDEDEVTGQMDPYVLLYRAARQKKKYNPYIEKFEGFQRDVTRISLELLRHYLPDDMLIVAIGRREQVNIPEFKKTTPLSYDIRVESQDETLETTFGQQLTMQHILQYVGKDLDKRTIGKLIKNSPFANVKDSFDDLTLEDDIADNDMLALERGEPVTSTPYVDPTFMLKRLSKRVKEPDFRYLQGPVQEGYQKLIGEYTQIEAEQAAKIAAAKNQFIPVDGALVTCDFYVPPKNPEEQAKRAKVPQRALEWLMQRLTEQGATMDQLESMNTQNLSEIADRMMQSRPQGMGQMPGGGTPGMPAQMVS